MSLEENLGKLTLNPLFNMSLGSKELFHSDLLAWLMKTYPDQSKGLLEGSLKPGPSQNLKVKREEGHIDLKVTFPGFEPIYIENKVKSLPDLRQLAEYERAVGKRNKAEFLLLSLPQKPWPGISFGRWNYLSYATLGQRVAQTATQMEAAGKPRFDSDVVRRYAEMLDGLTEIANHAELGGDSEDFFKGDIRDVLAEARIHDLFYKLRSSYLAAQVRDEIRKLLEICGFNEPELCFFNPYEGKRSRQPKLIDVESDIPQFQVQTSFTHGHAIVDAYCKLPGREDVLGIQLQGGNLRVCILTPRGLDRKKREERAKAIRDRREWFDFGPLEGLLGGTPLKVKPDDPSKWGCFEPEFVHRNIDIVNLELTKDSPLPRELPIGTVRSIFRTYIKKMLDLCPR